LQVLPSLVLLPSLALPSFLQQVFLLSFLPQVFLSFPSSSWASFLAWALL